MLVLLLNKCSNRDTKDILNNILKFFLPLHESSLLQAKTWVTVTSSGTLVCFSISGPRSRTAPSAGPVWLAQSSCSHFVLDAMLLFMEPMVPLATLAASSVPLVSITRRLLEIWPWGWFGERSWDAGFFFVFFPCILVWDCWGIFALGITVGVIVQGPEDQVPNSTRSVLGPRRLLAWKNGGNASLRERRSS